MVSFYSAGKGAVNGVYTQEGGTLFQGHGVASSGDNGAEAELGATAFLGDKLAGDQTANSAEAVKYHVDRLRIWVISVAIAPKFGI